MKVKVKPWNDAAMAALHDDEDWSVEADSIYGIRRGAGLWGGIVSGYANNGIFYADDGFNYPICVVEEYNDDNDDVLRYGEVITNDEIDGEEYIRIQLIAYDGDLYYHKMVDGEVVDFRKVGYLYD